MDDITIAFARLCATFPPKGFTEDCSCFLVPFTERMEVCMNASHDWLLDFRCGMLLHNSPEEVLVGVRHAWNSCATSTMRYLCEGYGMFWKHRTLHNKDTDTITQVRYADLLYTIYLQCVCNAHLGFPFKAGRNVRIDDGTTLPIHKICAQDIPYVRKYKLLRSMQPISKYSVRELMDAVMQLDAVWLKLRWDAQLLMYLELLEARIAEVVLVPHPDVTHDIEAYRVKTDQVVVLEDGLESALYIVSDMFLTTISMYTINFHRAIAEYACVDSAPIEELHAALEEKSGLQPEDLERVTTCIRANLKALSDRLLQQFAEAWMSTNYQTLMCRSSELERYKSGLTKKKVGLQAAEKPDAIMNFTRGVEAANAVITASQRPMNKYLDTPETECPISLPLAVIRLASKILLGRAGVDFNEFVYYRSYIHNTFERQFDNLDEILHNRNPLILQSFNYFHLYYAHKQYVCKDFYQLLTYWVAVATHFHGCSLNDKNIEPAMQYLVDDNWRSLLKYTKRRT